MFKHDHPRKADEVALPARGYGDGVIDGRTCRSRGGAISTLRLVAINDDYSAGYRAGYFFRD